MPLLGTPAAGQLGSRQLARLRHDLQRLGNEDVFRVVLIHHPPYEGVSPRKGLIDAAELCGVLSQVGAELVLYGHLHETGLTELATPRGPIPMIGLPSASARCREGTAPARYHLYRVSRAGDRWLIEIEARELEAGHDRFRIVERSVLNIGRSGGSTADQPRDAPEEVFS
jgi:3',5'-cyclic AMP phosphodiesterase CpdA